MLEVLFTKERDMRPHNVEELAHHGGHAHEMAGPARPTQPLRHLANIDGGLETGAVHAGCLGYEGQVAAHAGSLGEIARQVARILGQIFLGTELHRIDKDGQHQLLGAAPSFRQKRQVPPVQRAHGRHQGYALAPPARRLGPGAHGRGIRDHGHVAHEKDSFFDGKRPARTSAA